MDSSEGKEILVSYGVRKESWSELLKAGEPTLSKLIPGKLGLQPRKAGATVPESGKKTTKKAEQAPRRLIWGGRGDLRRFSLGGGKMHAPTRIAADKKEHYFKKGSLRGKGEQTRRE